MPVTTAPSCKMFQRDRFALIDFLLHRRPAGNHHIAAAAIELDDFDRNVLAHQRVQVAERADIHLRTGHERH